MTKFIELHQDGLQISFNIDLIESFVATKGVSDRQTKLKVIDNAYYIDEDYEVVKQLLRIAEVEIVRQL